MLRRITSHVLTILLFLGCLAGCGNTGDLYLPEDSGTNTNREQTES
ncbi:MAG: lipoprotein [Porticoccaceae bacterium]|nr:lipoprotein [Porticoccaceae bacterium]MDG1310889.1 lipoprotein [Porticoccaceae bacterium]